MRRVDLALCNDNETDNGFDKKKKKKQKSRYFLDFHVLSTTQDRVKTNHTFKILLYHFPTLKSPKSKVETWLTILDTTS